MLRPFMTFTNRVGQEVFLKLNDGEQPQTLFASDWKVSFPYSENDGGPDIFQVIVFFISLPLIIMTFYFLSFSCLI